MSLSPPDSTTGLLTGSGSFDSAFTIPPFQNMQLKNPAVRTILNSYDLLGQSTTSVAWTSKAFHDANPNVYKALILALKEASDIVTADPRLAVTYYVEDTKSKMTIDEILAIISDPRYRYQVTPLASKTFADFMFRVGKIKREAKDWKDLFFPEIWDLNGS